MKDMAQHTYFPFKGYEQKETYISYYLEEVAKLPLNSVDKYIETTFGKTFVRMHGNQSSPAIVLLQGIASTSLIWKDYIEKLSSTYCVYTIDNIYDVGLSTSMVSIKNLDQVLEWLDQVLIGLDLYEGIKLVGMSYGGWVASKFALKYPQKIDKLILIAPAATLQPFKSIFLFHSLFLLFPFKVFIEYYIYWIFDDMLNKSEVERNYVDHYIDELLLIKKCFVNRPLLTPTVLKDENLKKLKNTLIIIGENEKMYSAKLAFERVKIVAPNIKTSLIKGTGHDLIFIKKDEIIKKILDF